MFVRPTALRLIRNADMQWLLPSFLHAGIKSPAPSSTAGLDGIRGLASFFVYIRHFASATHANIQVGYGADPGNVWIIQLPFIRLLVQGPAMVALFFIISGYALSWAPLKSLHQQRSPEAALLRLSSATFRRAARLFLPGVISTFMIAVFLMLGLYDWGHAAYNAEQMPGFHEPKPSRLYTWSNQLSNWLHATWGFFSGGHPYDPHLWTLPIEFQCSISLFISLVAFARCRAAVRAGLLFSRILYCHYTNSWAGWLFFAGSFLAQLRLIQEDNKSGYTLLPSSEAGEISEEKQLPSPPTSDLISWQDICRILIFILGLYFLSMPDSGFSATAPGYMTLTKILVPPGWGENWRFPHCLGAFCAVYATSSTTTDSLRNLFSNPFSRYLGNISYAMYLMHGPTSHMLGFWLVPWMWENVTGNADMFGKELGFGIAFIIMTIVTVWAADLFWRGVDVKCVQLAKWFEKKLVEM